MFGLFGSKKKKEDPKQNAVDAINNLNSEINKLEEKIEFLEAKKNKQKEIAMQKLKAGDKTGAKQALAKKKKFDEQIKQSDGAIMMMEEQKMMLENAESMKSVFKTVEQSNSALKEATKGYNVEDLDRIKEDLEEIKVQQEEVNSFFKDYSVADNEELDDELAELENAMLEDNLPDTNKNEDHIIENKNDKQKVVVKQTEIKNDEKQLEAFLD